MLYGVNWSDVTHLSGVEFIEVDRIKVRPGVNPPKKRRHLPGCTAHLCISGKMARSWPRSLDS
jgi:hypothetical protein